MGWIVLHDKGAGVTKLSLQYFKKHVHRLGQVFEVNIDQDRAFHMEIKGTSGVMLLSGCNCGYGGEGPHGSVEILKLLGVKGVEFLVFGERHVKVDLRNRAKEHVSNE